MADAATAEAAPREPAPLDDVMLAMDVVDTLRHREHVVARELNEEEREADLIERLRKIYAAQGIEVSDRILKEGVENLKRSRFIYEPPPASPSIWLARLYIARITWGRIAGVAVLALAVLWAGYNWGIRLPAERRAEAERIELTETLPNSLEAVAEEVKAIAVVPEAGEQADDLFRTGVAAAASGDRERTLAALEELEALREMLSRQYEIRVVSGPDAMSGVWRVPDVNESARNYYLIVEAIGPDGEHVAREIRNEETGDVSSVTKWGQRVPESTYRQVASDKRDDGIIQGAMIGAKRRGHLEPEYAIPVDDGAITSW